MNLRKLIFKTINKSLLAPFDDECSLGGTATQHFHAFWAPRTGQELKKGEILKARMSDFLDVFADAGLGLGTATLVEKMGVIDGSYLPLKDLIALIEASYSMHVARWKSMQPRAVANLLGGVRDRRLG